MAQRAAVLGVDIGTTGCRACALSADGRLVGQASVAYEPDRPGPGLAEQDPRVWWEAFCAALARLRDSVSLEGLRGLALSSQSTALVPLDESGSPLRKAIIWQDRRCAPQCRQLTERFGGDLIREVIGWKPDTFLVWPKILWFMENEPELFERTRWLAQVNGYFSQRLCGRPVLERANAVGYPLALKDLTWHEQFCAWHDFPRDRIPPIVSSGRIFGELTCQAAHECGLSPGTALVAGGMDTACAAFAVGVERPGRAFEVSGTSGGVGVCSQTPVAEMRLGVAPHLFDGLYINHAPMSAAGASLSWFKDRFCGEERHEAARRGISAYELMSGEVAALPASPTGLLFLPYMAGERAPVWDPDARGAIVGLSLEVSRAQMIKAVMEGVAYALRQNVELAAAAGLAVLELRSCGGGSKSPVWCQMKADVIGLPLAVYPEHRDAAFGAALLAGVAVGTWTREDVEALLERERPLIYEPRKALTRHYQPFYARYCKLYERLKDLWGTVEQADGSDIGTFKPR